MSVHLVLGFLAEHGGPLPAEAQWAIMCLTRKHAAPDQTAVPSDARRDLAKRVDADPGVLTALCADAVPSVRAAAALNPRCPADSRRRVCRSERDRTAMRTLAATLSGDDLRVVAERAIRAGRPDDKTLAALLANTELSPELADLVVPVAAALLPERPVWDDGTSSDLAWALDEAFRVRTGADRWVDEIVSPGVRARLLSHGNVSPAMQERLVEELVFAVFHEDPLPSWAWRRTANLLPALTDGQLRTLSQLVGAADPPQDVHGAQIRRTLTRFWDEGASRHDAAVVAAIDDAKTLVQLAEAPDLDEATVSALVRNPCTPPEVAARLVRQSLRFDLSEAVLSRPADVLFLSQLALGTPELLAVVSDPAVRDAAALHCVRERITSTTTSGSRTDDYLPHLSDGAFAGLPWELTGRGAQGSLGFRSRLTDLLCDRLTSPESWEHFGALAATFEGTVGDLVGFCCDLVGEAA